MDKKCCFILRITRSRFSAHGVVALHCLVFRVQIVEDSLLEDVNSLLSAGEVPGLFTPQGPFCVLPVIVRSGFGLGLGNSNCSKFGMHET